MAKNSVRSIFEQAVDIQNEGKRREFVGELCSNESAIEKQVLELLKHHDEVGQFLEDGSNLPDQLLPISEQPGTRIGSYKLLQKIGEGGMGAVYMAEQAEPVRRRVALKIIKPGTGSREIIARFEAERQALALMDHPNIAKVLDAGTDNDGRPYFAMELVFGVSFNKYCDGNRLKIEERLKLFVAACSAVQHAHQKGVIHRDIKPSNILVTLQDGVPIPKVIDFGVAKALHQPLTKKTLFTQFGQVLGTLEYMSPEQAEANTLDVDTRSDVYSLGVLLYELLTGSTPLRRETLHNAAIDRLLQIVKDEEAPLPSRRLSESGDAVAEISSQRQTKPKRLGRLLRGDLDWIAMRALEKDRTRRYDTPAAMAVDIERFLSGEAVEAVPPSAFYRMRKFVRRYKSIVATVGLVIGVLLAGVIGTMTQTQRARLAEQSATESKFDAQRQLLSANERLCENNQLRVREMLDSPTPNSLSEAISLLREAATTLDSSVAIAEDLPQNDNLLKRRTHFSRKSNIPPLRSLACRVWNRAPIQRSREHPSIAWNRPGILASGGERFIAFGDGQSDGVILSFPVGRELHRLDDSAWLNQMTPVLVTEGGIMRSLRLPTGQSSDQPLELYEWNLTTGRLIGSQPIFDPEHREMFQPMTPRSIVWSPDGGLLSLIVEERIIETSDSSSARASPSEANPRHILFDLNLRHVLVNVEAESGYLPLKFDVSGEFLLGTKDSERSVFSLLENKMLPRDEANSLDFQLPLPLASHRDMRISQGPVLSPDGAWRVEFFDDIFFAKNLLAGDEVWSPRPTYNTPGGRSCAWFFVGNKALISVGPAALSLYSFPSAELIHALPYKSTWPGPHPHFPILSSATFIRRENRLRVVLNGRVREFFVSAPEEPVSIECSGTAAVYRQCNDTYVIATPGRHIIEQSLNGDSNRRNKWWNTHSARHFHDPFGLNSRHFIKKCEYDAQTIEVWDTATGQISAKIANTPTSLKNRLSTSEGVTEAIFVVDQNERGRKIRAFDLGECRWTTTVQSRAKNGGESVIGPWLVSVAGPQQVVHSDASNRGIENLFECWKRNTGELWLEFFGHDDGFFDEDDLFVTCGGSLRHYSLQQKKIMTEVSLTSDVNQTGAATPTPDHYTASFIRSGDTYWLGKQKDLLALVFNRNPVLWRIGEPAVHQITVDHHADDHPGIKFNFSPSAEYLLCHRPDENWADIYDVESGKQIAGFQGEMFPNYGNRIDGDHFSQSVTSSYLSDSIGCVCFALSRVLQTDQQRVKTIIFDLATGDVLREVRDAVVLDWLANKTAVLLSNGSIVDMLDGSEVVRPDEIPGNLQSRTIRKSPIGDDVIVLDKDSIYLWSWPERSQRLISLPESPPSTEGLRLENRNGSSMRGAGPIYDRLIFSQQKQLIGYVSHDQSEILICRIDTGECTASVPIHGKNHFPGRSPARKRLSQPQLYTLSPDLQADFSPDGAKLVVDVQQQTRIVKVTSNHNELLRLPVLRHSQKIVSMAISPDERIVATGSDDATICLWRAIDRNFVTRFDGFGTSIVDIQFSADSKHLAFLGRDGTMGVWKLASSESLELESIDGELLWHARDPAVKQMKLDLTGRRLIQGQDDGAITFRHLDDGTEESQIASLDAGAVVALQLSDDNSQLLVVTSDGTAALIDPATGDEFQRWNVASDEPVLSASWAPSGQLLAVCTSVVDLWDVNTRERIATIIPAEQGPKTVEFDLSGSWLTVKRKNETMRMIEINSLRHKLGALQLGW